MSRFNESPWEHQFRLQTTRLVVAVALALVLATWRLWFPVTNFPHVPLIRWAGFLPQPSIGFLSGLLLIGLAATLLSNNQRPSHWLLLACITLMLVLVLNNQHRLQPWAYHFLLSAWAVAMIDAKRALFWLRALMVSVYVYSAVSKFDLRFAETTGAIFVSTPLGWFTDRPIDPGFVTKLALALPVGELLVAATLLHPAIRHWGVRLAIGLHLSLLVILGPWGLQQRLGVLIWNVGCILQVSWLFRQHAFERSSTQASALSANGRLQSVFVLPCAPILLAVLMPLLAPWGYCDSWLAWGLYSTRAPRTELFIAAEAIRQLPDDLQPFCYVVGQDQIWARVAKTNWSLETLHVPIYPHERFDLAIDLALVDRLPTDQRWFRIDRMGVPDRRTGEFEVTTIRDIASLRRTLKHEFFWNAWPSGVER